MCTAKIMRKKIIAVSVIACLTIIVVAGISRRTDENAPDKDALQQLAECYVGYTTGFHVFPESDINRFALDDASVQKIVYERIEWLEKIVKPDSQLYKKISLSVEDAIKGQQTVTPGSTRSFGGSYSDLKINKIKIDGNTAQVDLSYVGHAIYGQWQNGRWVKVTPSNKILERLQCEKDLTGRWLIVSDDWKFAPGSEP